MTKKRLYLDVHVIQTLPPSNMNRDDTGSPKTAQYGGVRRARVSSQAWKKAIRNYFCEKGVDLGIRTKDILNGVLERVISLDPMWDREEALGCIQKAYELVNVQIKEDKKSGKKLTQALFFLGKRQAEELAKEIVENKEKYLAETKKTEKKSKTSSNKKKSDEKLIEILNSQPEIDIALFGRMVADEPQLNTDASCQVAHAISTHAIQTEFDYFTAMDDLSPEDQPGAGMLGNVEYNSSTLYRYANIAVHDFAVQLGDKTAAISACKLFVEAFSNSLPTGKENSFAHQTLPSLVMVTLREDRPVNLVSAFENPIKTDHQNGYVDASVDRLEKEYVKTEKFVQEPEANFYLNLSEKSLGEGLGLECSNLSDLLDQLGEAIGNHLDEVGE